MSYPSDPSSNPYAANPYAQQPPQQQPQYGYPQAPRPGYDYGYQQQMPGGFQQPVPTGPDGKVTTARVMMFIAGALQGVFSVLGIAVLGFAANEMADFQDVTDVKVGIGIAYFFCGLFLVHAVLGIMLAIWFARGGNGVRIGSIIWASFLTLFGLIALPFGIIWLGVGVTCIVLLAQSRAWFTRPQY